MKKFKNVSVYRGFFSECVDELAIPDIEFPGIDLSFNYPYTMPKKRQKTIIFLHFDQLVFPCYSMTIPNNKTHHKVLLSVENYK